MKRIFSLKRLNQGGFDHVMLGVIFVVVVGVIGTYFYVLGHAAPWSGAFAIGSTKSGYCMDATAIKTGGYAVLNKCNNTISQKWELMNAGTVSGGGKTVNAYTLQNFQSGTQECLDDWGRSKAIGKNNLVRLYGCNGVDPAQRFFWSGDGHQLKNVVSGLCIDVSGNGRGANTSLDFYTCKSSGTVNQDWFETSNSATATGGGGGSSTGSGGSGNPSGTGGTIKAAVGSNLCLTQAGNTVSLETCNGGTTQQWTQLNSSGGGTEVFQNASSHKFLGVAGQAVGTKVTGITTQGSTTTDWTAGDAGNGMNTLRNGVLTSTSAGQDTACLAAPNANVGTQLVLATCDGSASQQFTIPVPFVDSSSTTSSSSTSTDSSTSSTVSDTSSSSSSSSSADVNSVLQAFQAVDPAFDCTTLKSSTGLVDQCKRIFRE